MTAQSFAHRVLVEGDAKAFRRHWDELFPHLSGKGPKSDAEAEIAVHYGRTITASVPMKLRAWSHRWLLDHDYPTGLPDKLKPRAEQICPVIKEAVAIACGTRSPILQPAIPIIRGAMEKAVLDAEADGRLSDSPFVKARMLEARETTVKELFSATIEKLKGRQK